jgi:flagellin
VGLRINNNTTAFNAYRNLTVNDNMMAKSLEKLSSGFRINRSADDAAGLTRSEKLRAEVRGNQQAIRNAQDGVSFVQTAEAALNEVHSMLQRMRELAISAANTATSDGSAEQAEYDQLVAELNATGTRTKFAGKTVFSDYSTTGASLTFQVGASQGDTVDVADDLRIQANGATSGGIFSVNLDSVSLTTAASAAITTLDTALQDVSDVRANLGAQQNRMERIVNNLSVAVENLSASESRVRDTDMALEMAQFTRHQIMMQAGTAMLAQANAAPQSVMTLLQ